MNTTGSNRAKTFTRTIAFVIALLGWCIAPLAQRNAVAQDGQNQPAPAATIDDVFAEVGSRIPAFGGIFVDDEKDTLYVYMVPGEAGDLPTLDRAITAVVGDERPPQQRLEVLVGQYTFRQLKDWDDRMSP